MTSAIKHSLEKTGGLPRDGPLGLEMYLTDAQDTQPINGKTVPSVSGTIMEAPGIYMYCSDGESYESCLETVGDEEGDDASVYTDTVDAFDNKTTGKQYLTTWL